MNMIFFIINRLKLVMLYAQVQTINNIYSDHRRCTGGTACSGTLPQERKSFSKQDAGNNNGSVRDGLGYMYFICYW